MQLFFIFFGLASVGFRMSAWTAAILGPVDQLRRLHDGGHARRHRRHPARPTRVGRLARLGHWHTFTDVIAFQAVRNVYPAISSYIILLFLGTSVVSQISAQDLFYVASFIDSRTFRNFRTSSSA